MGNAAHVEKAFASRRQNLPSAGKSRVPAAAAAAGNADFPRFRRWRDACLGFVGRDGRQATGGVEE